MIDKQPTQLALPLDNGHKINTLKGVIPLESLGRVLIHEHVFCRVRPSHFSEAKQYILQQFDQLLSKGVKTIVDLTTYVLPDPYVEFLQYNPMNIICCAGYYLMKHTPSVYHSLDKAELAEKLKQKVEVGIGKTRIKPGILKVASSGRNLTKFERNALQAVGLVQRDYKLPIVTHAMRGARKQMEIFLEVGANPQNILISHMEMELKGNQPSSPDQVKGDMLWILKTGASIFFGDFTAHPSPYRDNVLDLLRYCYSMGYSKQIFLSTDSYWSYRSGKLQIRGSNKNSKIPRDYNYIFALIVPFLLKNGFTGKDIELFLKENPLRFFDTFD